MKRFLGNVLVTGGYGFIGSNFINYLFNKSISGDYKTNFKGKVVNVDKMTYAANKLSIKIDDPNYIFSESDINDESEMRKLIEDYDITTIVNFAAESHVGNSIKFPERFIENNVKGTNALLNAAKDVWNCSASRTDNTHLFHQISTDEVYGTSINRPFTEEDPYNPSNPYAASKASSECTALSYYHTFGVPITISNCTNNFGAFQHKEKLIPKMLSNMLLNAPLTVHGDGSYIRDWIYVEDHNEAVYKILSKGRIGEKYNISAHNEISNINIIYELMDYVSESLKIDKSNFLDLIRYTENRPGQDTKYSLNTDKINKELGWKSKIDFHKALKLTVNWYLNNKNYL